MKIVLQEEKQYYTTDGRMHTWEDSAKDHQFELDTYYTKIKFPTEPAMYLIRNKKQFQKMIEYEMGSNHMEQHSADKYKYIFPERFVCFHIEFDDISERGYKCMEKVYYAITFDEFQEFTSQIFKQLK